MLNRRHLRVKVLQALYAYYQSEEENYRKVEEELMLSVEHIYDLYLYLLLSFSELKDVADLRMEESKAKRFQTEDDKNPNLKFSRNVIFKLLEENRSLRNASEQNSVNWIGVEHHEMFKKMYTQIKESEAYITYMNTEELSFEDDLNFAINLFKAEIANSSLMYHFFEEKSIHWLDDIDLACTMVIKTLKTFELEGENRIMPLYKDKEDETHFIKNLLRKTISMDAENLILIDELTQNWDLDRIAKMDIILMKMAITEFQVFSNIPEKVTLNEYIEISKFYSTPKSNAFINGILDKAIERLKKDDKINKIGRGLIN